MEDWQYIALLGAVIVVLAIIIPRNKATLSNSTSKTDEIEQLELSFTQFMENMEKEHEELIKMLSSSLQAMKEENSIKNEKISYLEKKCEQLDQQIIAISHTCTALETKLNVFPALIGEQKKDSSFVNEIEEEQDLPRLNTIHMRFPEIFQMYENGKSIEAIAKKVNKNKGEIQLILQLAEQEEKAQHG